MVSITILKLHFLYNYVSMIRDLYLEIRLCSWVGKIDLIYLSCLACLLDLKKMNCFTALVRFAQLSSSAQ